MPKEKGQLSKKKLSGSLQKPVFCQMRCLYFLGAFLIFRQYKRGGWCPANGKGWRRVRQKTMCTRGEALDRREKAARHAPCIGGGTVVW